MQHSSEKYVLCTPKGWNLLFFNLYTNYNGTLLNTVHNTTKTFAFK